MTNCTPRGQSWWWYLPPHKTPCLYACNRAYADLILQVFFFMTHAHIVELATGCSIYQSGSKCMEWTSRYKGMRDQVITRVAITQVEMSKAAKRLPSSLSQCPFNWETLYMLRCRRGRVYGPSFRFHVQTCNRRLIPRLERTQSVSIFWGVNDFE